MYVSENTSSDLLLFYTETEKAFNYPNQGNKYTISL
jgi:hypothetical protein